MWVEVLACLPLLWLVWLLLQKDPPPLHGVYSQPGRWFCPKWLAMRLMLRKRQKQQKKQHLAELPDQTTPGYGTKSHSAADQMDTPQTLSPDPMAIDAAYFNGFNKDGACFVMRIGRRHNREAELWLSINLPGVGFFQSPAHPDTTVYNVDGSSFSAAGLKFECIEPMRRWRITYNGLLREGLCNEYSDEDEGKTKHVAFSFIWDAFTDMFDFDTDINSSALATAIAREKWSTAFWETLKSKHQTHYEQWGEMRGVVKVHGHPDQQISLRGCRDHSYGVRDWRMFHRYVVVFGYLENGITFHVNTLCWTEGLSYLQCGYLSFPSGTLAPVSWVDMDLPSLGENGSPPDEFSFMFGAGGKIFQVEVKASLCPTYYHHEDWGNVIYEKICDLSVNGVPGYAVTEFCQHRPGSSSPVPRSRSLPLLTEPSDVPLEDTTAYLLPFSKPACCCARLVGGKGCQLAMLSQLKSKDFVVPQGFCLTLAAFDQQLKNSPELSIPIDQLRNIACGKTSGALSETCEAMCQTFQKVKLSPELQRAIKAQLTEQFGDNYSEKSFAVRSSAAGEDGAEMSAAGQMDTFLGVKGLDKMFDAITKCWASQFSFTAVEYRRQHGQPVVCGMGVVIQEMVPAQSAGVLFTTDPMTGSPGKMMLNANYGLGESVVSGEAEPDTITVYRTWNDHLTVGEKQIGKKNLQIHLTESGGTRNVEQSEGGDKTCSISDDIVLRLAAIGVNLEKRFSDPRDIEWAVCNNTIYLLQARPITTLDQETDSDIIHEFDSALVHDNEILTTCNIGEMMPSAMTPLTLSVFFKSIDISGQDMMSKCGVLPHIHDFYKFVGVCGNMGFINMHFLMGTYEGIVLGNDKRMAELSVMGETRQDFTYEEIEDYHGKQPIWKRLKNAINNYRNVSSAYGRLEKWASFLENFSIADKPWKTAEELYKFLDDNMHLYSESWTDSFHNSAKSGALSSVLMGVLSKGKAEWTTEYYADVAMMLSDCEDVYSADVPATLQRMSKTIGSTGDTDHFTSLTAEEAVLWLQSEASGHAGQEFKVFMEKHGHRCVKEAEFYEKSWQSEPHKVTSVLQTMLVNSKNIRNHKKTLSSEDAIKQIKTPTTFIGRQVLKWALPKARKAVGQREWGKSVAIKMTEIFKRGYWKLASLMVEEGRLPRAELLFFLTHAEIGQLLKTRSGKMVARAHRRMKVYPKQLEMQFPRVTRGHPVPIEENGPEEDFVITSLKLEGMPASQGIVRGKARVVKTLKDAASIQPGEILIVPFTDVGWSPYFPLIGGLVTEIGGLISHGAVVAREYGLPCVVKVQRATSLFKTGDDVLLNGSTGILQKIEDLEET